MNRQQAAKLLGLESTATAEEATKAYLAHMKALDERIQTAPNSALKQKYQTMREELLVALQILTAANESAAPTSTLSDLNDLPAARPQSVAPEVASATVIAGEQNEAQTPTRPKQKAKERVQHAPWMGVLVAVGLLIGIGTLAVTGTWSVMWESIKPVSQEELARQLAETSGLLGEIDIYQQRLESARRDLGQAVREAQRASADTVASLTHWQHLTDQSIFDTDTIPKLQGKRREGEALVQEKAFSGAKTVLTEVRDTYQALLAEFNAGESLWPARQQAMALALQWQSQKTLLAVGDPPPAVKATSLMTEAEQSEVAGQLVQALTRWKQVSTYWHAALQAGKALVSAREPAQVAAEEWRSYQKQYGVSDPPVVAQANALQAEAAAAEKRGDFEQAQQHWKDLLPLWQTAQEQVADAVAVVKERQRIAAAQQKEIDRIARLAGTFVSIPQGRFMMGDNYGNKAPMHAVQVVAFKLGKTEVTFAQWDACVASEACRPKPDDEGWGRGSRPVINVNYDDITQQFIPWLNKSTGRRYRLPTEAEWEYAARAGSTTDFNWGDAIGKNQANCDGCGSRWDNKQTAPVASFSPNQWGLYDMHGNVWEWVEDCWHENYKGAPSDGSSWMKNGECNRRVLRGGSWYTRPDSLRSAYRYGVIRTVGNFYNGFRLVQDN